MQCIFSGDGFSWGDTGLPVMYYHRRSFYYDCHLALIWGRRKEVRRIYELDNGGKR